VNWKRELILAKYRLRYGYYLKNAIERYNNRKKLNKLRNNTTKNKDPLVSILIATYNRPKCLTQRAIKSVLNQTYENFEIVVVGDHCSEETVRAVEKIDDERLIFRMAVLYHSNLSFMKYDIDSWKYYQPGDWNLWRRMNEAGVKIGFLDNVVGNHYQEMSQLGV